MKYLALSLTLILAFSNLAHSQGLSRDIMLDESGYVDNSAVEDAQNQAKKLLQTQPQTLRKQNFPKVSSRSIGKKKDLNITSAPFGLNWGANVSTIKNLGVYLQKVDEKDYARSYRATHLPKEIEDFRDVNITFGEEDSLWRILAYGNFLNDDANASKVLRLYRIYYDLLKQKYGNAQEFYTPTMIDVEVKDAKGKTITEQKPAQIGNDQFLKQLKDGTAVLYATFNNQDVGAALAVNVDGSGKSYIVVDYKNLKILRARENKTLDAL